MVKHIILWDHKEGLTAQEKARDAVLIKSALEGLVGVIPGLIELRVHGELLDSSNADLMLYSVLESHEALLGYQAHPAHVKAATEVVRPRVTNRRCADFEC